MNMHSKQIQVCLLGTFKKPNVTRGSMNERGDSHLTRHYHPFDFATSGNTEVVFEATNLREENEQ